MGPWFRHITRASRKWGLGPVTLQGQVASGALVQARHKGKQQVGPWFRHVTRASSKWDLGSGTSQGQAESGALVALGPSTLHGQMRLWPSNITRVRAALAQLPHKIGGTLAQSPAFF